MESILKSVQEYIRSGEYFRDARNWYNFKYLYPLSQRSFLILITCIILIIFCFIVVNIYLLLPLTIQVRYALYAHSYESTAKVKQADQIPNQPLISIADIMIRAYITHREQYDFNNLKEQFLFVQNSSTRLVFRKFFSYMSIDNPLSPVLRYKKSTKRSIDVLSSSYPTPGEAIITFQSIANTIEGGIFENIIWQAHISYNIDNINLDAPTETKFNFVVTNYHLKLLQNKIKK